MRVDLLLPRRSAVVAGPARSSRERSRNSGLVRAASSTPSRIRRFGRLTLISIAAATSYAFVRRLVQA
ncbi:hypothetical protein OG349_03970 [Streptomyces sp. NBC_01317]|uniref:hypothetical protein n=1 Tax=Streptomyces sp. NBC_01317 TaxID=2903822 RepID=UPI002E10C999|nr:hypothetical protein OG349_03970 [Streptomyces sp. NBC_01317]